MIENDLIELHSCDKYGISFDIIKWTPWTFEMFEFILKYPKLIWSINCTVIAVNFPGAISTYANGDGLIIMIVMCDSQCYPDHVCITVFQSSEPLRGRYQYSV